MKAYSAGPGRIALIALGLLAALSLSRRALGECCLQMSGCTDLTQMECGALGGEYICNGVCNGPGCLVDLGAPTCAATPTNTATPTTTTTATATASSTPTFTRVPNGGSCTAPDQCASANCVDGVCVPVASPAPAASPTGLAAAFALLVGLGGLALLRARGRQR